jgi:hypothetical protein
MVGEKDERVPELEVEGSRGILTEDDRNLLADTAKREELSASALSQRWSKIRQRVQNSIMDYLWLVYCLPEDQRREIFESEQLSRPSDPQWQEKLFSYIITFAYQQLDRPSRLERTVASGIWRAEILNESVAQVGVDITVAPQSTVKEIRNRFSEHGLEGISYYEIDILYHAGLLTAEERSALELEKQPRNLTKKQGNVYSQNPIEDSTDDSDLTE